MGQIAVVSSECFFVKRNVRRGIVDKKTASTFANILKDCLTLSVVIMTGAALTFLLGS